MLLQFAQVPLQQETILVLGQGLRMREEVSNFSSQIKLRLFFPLKSDASHWSLKQRCKLSRCRRTRSNYWVASFSVVPSQNSKLLMCDEPLMHELLLIQELLRLMQLLTAPNKCSSGWALQCWSGGTCLSHGNIGRIQVRSWRSPPRQTYPNPTILIPIVV